MSPTIHEIGENVEVLEDDNGNAIIRTTNGDQYVRVTQDGVEIDSLSAESVNGGVPVVNGDGVDRTFWVVSAGASDPADAAPEDIIMEEEG